MLLVTVTGLKFHSWYLFVTGFLGMLQNAMLAAAAQRPKRRGLTLTFVDTIATNDVSDELMDLEATIGGTGDLLRDEFLPGRLPEDESQRWTGMAERPIDLHLWKRLRSPMCGR